MWWRHARRGLIDPLSMTEQFDRAQRRFWWVVIVSSVVLLVLIGVCFSGAPT